MPIVRWPWAGVSSPPIQGDHREHKNAQGNDGIIANFQKELETLQAPLLALTAFALGSVATVTASLAYFRYGKRLRNGDWITPDVFAKRRWIKGFVTA